jgi:hypothetical protein
MKILLLYSLIFLGFRYSARKLLTGFAIAAFNACTLTVRSAINIVATPATTNIHQLIST